MPRVLVCALLFVALGLSGCAPRRPPVAPVAVPKYPTFVKPEVPAGLAVPAAAQQRFDEGWLRLQAGDERGASRDFAEAVKQAPGFYPAETALGTVALIDKNFKDALASFTAALEKNDRYLPALEGRVQAALGVGDDLITASALEQLLKVDPAREEARNRLEMIQFRIVQGQLSTASRARAAGRLDEAQTIIERALAVSPSSGVLLRELALVEAMRGALESAEQHARRSVEIDGADPESLVALGSVLEAQGKLVEAVDLYARAVAIEPRAGWREKRDALRNRAKFEALPAEYRAIPTAATVTRAQVAATLGIDLEPLITRAPRRATIVVTDVRTHWAAPWILPVVQAGIMDAYPNHTFQPNAPVRRSDLAQMISQLLGMIAAGRPDEVARWRAARPRLDDVSAGHVSYRAIALAVAAGAMTSDETGRFWPARLASGADLVAAVARLKPLVR
jgi:tetratricopeptide (TPR) repeat protein